MKTRQGSSGGDVVVLICCATAILTCMGMVGHVGRERAKRAVCLANLSHLITAWNQYADDNNDYVINGDAGEYASAIAKGPGWVNRDWLSNMTQSARETAIREGALFSYVRDIRVYRCPLASPVETRSYSIVDSMNVFSWFSDAMQAIRRRAEIGNPAARCVFLDDSGNVGNSWGGWTIFTDGESWWDPPPIRHAGGTTLSFVDGHVEYWKWVDERTVRFGQTGMAGSGIQAGNPDIKRCQVAVWGDKPSPGNAGGGR